jgi:ketosteroid isomerase-like protein
MKNIGILKKVSGKNRNNKGEMKLLKSVFTAIALIVCCTASIFAQTDREKTESAGCGASLPLDGVYRINVESSDKLYSVIESASSNIPFSEQQQFFIDLAVRLTPPDLLAIECRGKSVSLASSRSPRVEFPADGVTRRGRDEGGRIVSSRIRFNLKSLVFNSTDGDDSLIFTFTPLEGGQRLRVSRSISTRELIEPVVIQTVYDKISGIARWDIFNETEAESQTAGQSGRKRPPISQTLSRADINASNQASVLRRLLDQWIEATNRRDIEKQMSFYMPRLKAFYLARGASRGAVRAEKNRVFASASLIDITAAQPEIIFMNGGREAVMRFRKRYDIKNKNKSRRGEVIQELRWQQTGDGWKIFSERDIKVIR